MAVWGIWFRKTKKIKLCYYVFREIRQKLFMLMFEVWVYVFENTQNVLNRSFKYLIVLCSTYAAADHHKHAAMKFEQRVNLLRFFCAVRSEHEYLIPLKSSSHALQRPRKRNKITKRSMKHNSNERIFFLFVRT